LGVKPEAANTISRDKQPLRRLILLATWPASGIPQPAIQQLLLMKKLLFPIAAAVLCSSLLTVHAQMGRGPGGPDFSGAMAKLFGNNSAFTATAEVHAKNGRSNDEMTMPGKIAFRDSKSRFELSMSEMKGAKMPPGMVEQMKQMGMDNMVSISLPEKKVVYLIYPGLKAYAEMRLTNATPADADLKITELGKESCEGHDCIKNKAVVTDKDGQTHEFTVWNATDLKKFPVKIVTDERNNAVTILFKDVKFEKPADSQFDPPTDFKKYDSMMSLMQEEMMKKMGGGMNMPNR
jgi:hypothetical protein